MTGRLTRRSIWHRLLLRGWSRSRGTRNLGLRAHDRVAQYFQLLFLLKVVALYIYSNNAITLCDLGVDQQINEIPAT